jgi:hypothetical protein
VKKRALKAAKEKGTAAALAAAGIRSEIHSPQTVHTKPLNGVNKIQQRQLTVNRR